MKIANVYKHKITGRRWQGNFYEEEYMIKNAPKSLVILYRIRCKLKSSE